ncbi:glycosyl hydrolases family 2, sugar binding domain [Terrimicrobium sacchariphilum]|uniref:Glycosyl hydrolases family 2, sugar binding domain n=1 Tax=Terrimicrobium sacchariphilum TaxID=690879 RepID=A0A146GE67_TERSA|nr:hypothetical protein [Terrimicrobium sacchariphilum]GAT35432.1 glycosyl hydrolases family 2, sugar binding domain [Terrimicrobium sacchariphilum]
MTSRALYSVSRTTGVCILVLILSICRDVSAKDLETQCHAIALEGVWRFFRDKETKPQDEKASRNNAAEPMAAPDLDDSGWEEIRVPGAYDHQGPAFLGVAWYRREVMVPSTWKGKPVFLQLPPVDDRDETFWNGVRIGAMGSKQFTTPRLYRVPDEAIRWGERNVIAVKVTNNYMRGGFTSDGPARLLSQGPFAMFPPDGMAPLGEEEMKLDATRDLAGKLGKAWSLGWRDEGTADTRPKLYARKGFRPGDEALGFEITEPNASGEFVDYTLQEKEIGAIWQLRDYDYLAFDYQTDDTEGEMRLYLNPGGWRWGKGRPGYGTSFPVRKGGWTRVILPFSEFRDIQPRMTIFLPQKNLIKTLSLGYRNNEMQSPGEVKFANFRVGRFNAAKRESVHLDGFWHLGRGETEDAAGADFHTWPVIAVGFSWTAQGIKDGAGTFWLKQEVEIPETWKGMQLRLRLGQIRSRDDDAEVFFNGRPVGGTTDHDPQLDVNIPAGLVNPGGKNTVAVRLRFKAAQNAGLFPGPFEILPQQVWVAMREAGSGEEPVVSTEFDPGPVVGGRKYELFLRLPLNANAITGGRVTYVVKDCFHRVVAEGEGVPTPVPDTNFQELAVKLSEAQSRQLYFSEFFDVHVLATNVNGAPIFAGTQLKSAMRFDQRDAYERAPLAESWEETPYGRLKLIDVIEAGKDPSAQGYVYKQGGHRESWVGRRAYSTQVQGVTVEEFLGRKYREANNNEWFGYRVGRGRMIPGKAYLVRIEYPEDKTRYAPINIDAGRNYQGLGYKTGVGPGDPFDDYPLSGKYEFFDTVVIPDDTTYGSKGSRTVPSDKGIWIFFLDTGRAYVPQYQAGPAVSRILVYELPEGAAAHAAVRYPKDAPRRLFVADWEREPEWVARDMVQHALISGYNAIAPSILKWGSLAFWHVDNVEKVKLRPVRPVRDDLPPDEVSALDRYLKASREAGITIFPRLEYGGTDALPKEARAIGLDGKPARPNRFHTWCSNLMDPRVGEEFFDILNQVVGKNIKNNPQLGGILFRIRSDRLPISYGPSDVAQYARDTGDNPPAGLEGEALSKWASDPERQGKYGEWWQGKRRDFHAKIVEQLKSYRPDLQMLYYNWDPDRWNLGEHEMSPEDFRDFYNVHKSIDYYRRSAAYQKDVPPGEYVAMVRDQGLPHHQVRPELYASLDGFALLGPVNWRYLADNPQYLDFFRTGRQLALTKLFDYEEHGRWNVQGDNYETSELMSGGPAFAMAEQVLAVFHGDPWIFTETAYTYGGGYMEQHREFAQAFLSLPAMPGQVVATPGVEKADDLRVRRYDVKNQVHLSVAYKGYTPQVFSMELPGPWGESVTVTDQVSGERVPAEVRDGKLSLHLELPPMVLKSYLVEPSPRS